jgi:hypothetical protein
MALGSRPYVGPWPFAALLLIAWGLLAHGLRVLSIARPLRLLLTVSLLALAVVVWNAMAPQPRLALAEVRIRRLPSTISPGSVELVLRNSGSLPAVVVGTSLAQLMSLFRTPSDLGGGIILADLSRQLDDADRLPADGAMVIPPGQTVRAEVAIAPSSRAWFVARGEVTVLVTARLRYRDRLLPREKDFCLFTNPPSGIWQSCPFLN